MYQFCHYSNTLRLFAACLILLLTACTGPSLRQRQQEHLLVQTDSSRQQMIKFINQQTQYLRMEMENKINDPFSAEKARKWQPVASAVHQETSKLMQLIEKLCERLRQGNTEVLFRKDTNAIHLHRYLTDYKRKILRLNEGMTAEFGNQIFEEIDTSLSEMKGAASIQAAVAQLSQPESLVWL